LRKKALYRFGLHSVIYLSIVGAVFAAVFVSERASLEDLQAEQRADVNEVLGELSRNLAIALTRKTAAASGIAQTVSLLPTVSQEQFSSISEGVVSNDPSIVSVSLIRDWRISHAYPLEGNPNPIGTDLSGSLEGVDAINSVHRQSVGIVQGPLRPLLELDGFIIRQPVFLPLIENESATAQAPGDFWGLVLMAFEVEPFLAEIGIEGIASDYEIAILDPLGSVQGDVIGNSAIFELGPSFSDVTSSLGIWDIAVAPAGGWISSLPNPWPIRIVALLLAAVLSLLARQTLRLGEVHKRDAQRLTTAINTMPDGFVLYDEDDRLVVCNEQYKDIYRKSAAAMTPGRSFKSILEYGLSNGQYAEAEGREQEWLEERLEQHTRDEAFVEQELEDGRWLRIIERATPDGSRAGLRVDITEIKNSEKKLEMLLNRNPAIVMSQGRDWKIQTCSDAWTQVFGYSREETVGRDLTEFMASEDAVQYRLFRETTAVAEKDPASISKSIFKIEAKSGDPRSVEIQSMVETNDGEWLNLIAITDITPIVRAKDDLERLVENDELTGLLSRRGLQRRFADGQRTDSVGFFLVDLDHFKSVNDGYGHEAGDDLLKAIAESLSRIAGKLGCAIRLGGEEFALVRPWSGWREAGSFAEELRKTLEETSIDYHGKLVQRSASIGYVEIGADDKISDSMHLADLAQREAKMTGRNKCLAADRELLDSLEDRGAFIKNDQIQAALLSGELIYEIQPIVDARSDRLTGFEALIRWYKSNGDIIMPDKFIDTLHEVLRQPHFSKFKEKLRLDVLEQLVGFAGSYVGFNFFLDEIAYPGAAEAIDGVFGEALGRTKKRMLIEISERAFHSRLDMEMLVSELKKLRDRGYLIALDDFGVESSNIQRLLQFPIDVVKLDKSLVTGIVESDRQRKAIYSIAHMIEALDLICIVEGVETEEQSHELQAMGLVVQQGFYHARPGLPRDIAQRLGSNVTNLSPPAKSLAVM
jgi:diguanylate cyclase (GGDEF)-like protein/PAS domain S-box-containing protein